MARLLVWLNYTRGTAAVKVCRNGSRFVSRRCRVKNNPRLQAADLFEFHRPYGTLSYVASRIPTLNHPMKQEAFPGVV